MSVSWREQTFFIFGALGGLLFGILFTVMLLNFSIAHLANSILPQISIANVNFDLNETVLVEAMNRTFGAN